MAKLELPEVTLLCMDTKNHALALHAILHSMSGINFGKVIWLTDQKPPDLPEISGIDIEIIPIINDIRDYSTRMLKTLLPYIKTKHVLCIQWDGFVVNPEKWNTRFLDYDYIGAPWPWHPEGSRVGNGGFSLRSKKLIEALRDGMIRTDLPKNEDEIICHVYAKELKKKYKIKIAPESIADEFSFECGPPKCSAFGFHALFNFGIVMPQRKAIALVNQLPDDVVEKEQFKALIHQSINLDQRELVAGLAKKVLKAYPRNMEAIQLLAKYEPISGT